MKNSNLPIFIVLCAVLLRLTVYADDSKPINPKPDSTNVVDQLKLLAEKKSTPPQNSIVNKNDLAGFDESKLSAKQRRFLERKQQINMEYSDSTATSREEKIRKLKQEILDK